MSQQPRAPGSRPAAPPLALRPREAAKALDVYDLGQTNAGEPTGGGPPHDE